MSEIIIRGRVEIPHSTYTDKTHRETIDIWLERITRLTNTELEYLCPLVGADDAADTQRKLIRICTILAHPERVLANWLSNPIGELLEGIYQASTVAMYLRARECGDAPEVITFEHWCCQRLAAGLLQTDTPDVPQIASWFYATAAAEGAGTGAEAAPCRKTAQTPSASRTEAPACSASCEAAPEEIAEEETSRIERKHETATALEKAPGPRAGNDVMHLPSPNPERSLRSCVMVVAPLA